MERLFIAACGTVCAAIVLAHATSLLIVGPDGVQRVSSAATLAVVTLAAGALASYAAARLAPARAAWAGGAVGMGALGLLAARDPALASHAAALPLLTACVPGALRGLASRLPASLDGARLRRPGRAVAWAFLALVLLAQTARFSAFMVDASLRAGSVVPFVPQTVRHMCLAAYVQAADLVREGRPGVYDPASYRRTPDGRAPASSVPGIEPYLEDPFLYPPPFLLLPRLALTVADDYRVLRTGQFVLQAFGLAAVALSLAAFAGGRAGLNAGLLLPALFASTPVLFNFQYGQAQLAMTAAAVAGMLLVQRGRPGWGGLALAVATWSKIFPGVLVVLLLAQRRRGALGLTLAWGLALALLSVAVLGWAPWREYLGVGQALSVASGAAVRGFEDDFITVVNNVSAYSLVLKLRYAGAPGMTTALAEGVSWAWSLLPLGLAWWVGRRPLTPSAAAQAWLALLNLAAMRSPNAPAVYALAGTLWLLTLLAWQARTPARVAALGLCWVLFLGLPPLPARGLLVALSLLVQALVIGVNLWALRGAVPVRSAGEKPA